MRDAIEPVLRESLSDRLARDIRGLIRRGDLQIGDRLPPIMEMAKRFGVGHPTVREALKKLETMGIVEIRHGAGVYVVRAEEVLVLASPDYTGAVTPKLLLDLIRTRLLLETQTVSEAVKNGTAAHLKEMRRLLTVAGENFGDAEALHANNMGFHRQIAVASGNQVVAQLLDVLVDLFSDEQRFILGIHGPRERDHQEHLGILEAIEQRDTALAVERMRAHLEGVQDAILRWDPEHHPVA